MIYFLSDYSQGAHPKVMEALLKTNMEHSGGYGLDEHCAHAAEMIKDMIGLDDCQVYMMVGGTPCNVTIMAASLRPYESAVALRTGHAYFHETGDRAQNCRRGRRQWKDDAGADRQSMGRI